MCAWGCPTFEMETSQGTLTVGLCGVWTLAGESGARTRLGVPWLMSDRAQWLGPLQNAHGCGLEAPLFSIRVKFSFLPQEHRHSGAHLKQV